MNEKLVKHSKIYFIMFLMFLLLNIIAYNDYLENNNMNNSFSTFMYVINDSYLIAYSGVAVAVCGITTLIMIYLMEFSIIIGKPIVYRNSFSNYDKLKRYLRKKIKKLFIYCLIKCNIINKEIYIKANEEIENLIKELKFNNYKKVATSIIFCPEKKSRYDKIYLNDINNIKSKIQIIVDVSFKDKEITRSNILINPFNIKLLNKRYMYFILQTNLRYMLNLKYKVIKITNAINLTKDIKGV